MSMNPDNCKKRLGVIGGLGPMATAYFMELVTEMTDASRDQDHIEMMILSLPSIPDRTAYILGESKESPVPFIIEAGKKLVLGGADIIAIPCMTSHYFYKDFSAKISAPVLNGIQLTASLLKSRGINCAGIMATDGTIKSELFQASLEKAGISACVPSEENQKCVMSLIYDYIKAGKNPDMSLFEQAARDLTSQGAESIILGCTELPLLGRYTSLGNKYISVLDVLAANAIIECGGKLKPEYQDLLS